jgi:hypothetical protein
LYEMDATAKIFGGCWIAVGLVYYLTLRLVFKKKLQLAA